MLHDALIILLKPYEMLEFTGRPIGIVSLIHAAVILFTR